MVEKGWKGRIMLIKSSIWNSAKIQIRIVIILRFDFLDFSPLYSSRSRVWVGKEFLCVTKFHTGNTCKSQMEEEHEKRFLYDFTYKDIYS